MAHEGDDRWTRHQVLFLVGDGGLGLLDLLFGQCLVLGFFPAFDLKGEAEIGCHFLGDLDIEEVSLIVAKMLFFISS